ncbi:hypothetical protein [Nocardia sp. NPDC052112]|uniref:hypothetical protein n=1 Tax=Nocardia sp. NPDC052112 TaxID=3155646 RepID=UPI0034200EE6
MSSPDYCAILLPEWTYDHVVDTGPGTIAVTAVDDDTAARIGTRVVRQLIMRRIESRGGIGLHAGTVAINGDGVLVGGQAGAGKTAMLTALLEHGAAPVSGDRTMVMTHSESWLAVGVPMAWRITAEGMARSLPLAQAWRDLTPARGRNLVEGKVELTPLEVAEIFGTRPAAHAAVGRIVVMQRSPEPPPRVVDGPFLCRHMDFGRGDSLGGDWLNLFPHAVSHTAQHDWWSRLAAAMPVLALTWTDPAQLPSLADRIRRWIRS